MSLTKHIEKLCQQVSEEQDGDKLLSLVDELNRELAHLSETPENVGVDTFRSSPRQEEKKPDAA